MPINMSAIEAAARRIAMDKLESGVRAGCEYMSELLKATVGKGSAIPMKGPAGRGTASPFKYRRGSKDKGGKGTWEAAPPEWGGAAKLREGPPGVVSGAGLASVGYKILERDDAKGTIRVLLGGDSPETKGGFTALPGYMLGWDLGIRIKGPGDSFKDNTKRTGPVVQRLWLRSTVDRYLESFADVVNHVASIS